MKEIFSKHPIAYAVSVSLLLASTPLLAAGNTDTSNAIDDTNNAELLQRMELLERELQALKAELRRQSQPQPPASLPARELSQQRVAEERLDVQPINPPIITQKKDDSSGTQLSYGGFIKVDGLWSKSSDQQRSNGGGDDYLVPSSIGVGDGSGGGDGVFDSTAKFSRFWLKTTTQTSAGLVTGYVEMDFNGSADERLTNQSSNGMRHAYLSWDYSANSSLLVGQTWSTFFNDAALPEAVDFVGPTSGVIFARQTQVRWTHRLGGRSSVMLAAENPSVSVYDAGGGYEHNAVDDSLMPDLVARYNGQLGNDFHYSVAGMVREIAYDDATTGLDDRRYGYGISVSGKWQFSNGDDLKFMVSQGNLGRYLALNAFRDAAVAADGGLDLIDSGGGYVAYRHLWNDKFRSTFSYAVSTADNPAGVVVSADLPDTRLTETVANANINLIYSPTPKLSFGAEYLYATREIESGQDGDLKRLQFMGKWLF